MGRWLQSLPITYSISTLTLTSDACGSWKDSGMPLRSVASTRYPSSQVSDESHREDVESFGVRANFL
ncbi:Uncharacterized protein HZ326_25359 [Fusarium oxysporum f. sp. albedinis]|nr:Uncharacterized protein HZ326_25359 [Fusarium oxysporum f. sp. albedinis]